MELFDVLLQAGLITTILVVYLIFLRKQSPSKGSYKKRGWNYFLKVLFARYAVKRWKAQLSSSNADELPRGRQHEGVDGIGFRTTATDGTTILLGIRKLCGRQPLSEVTLYVKLEDGTSYRLPRHPETAIGSWEIEYNSWKAEGLKIQILEPYERMRILYNGLLISTDGCKSQHVKLNLIWTTATRVYRYPEDWSNKLAAQALALEPWRNDEWPFILGKWEDGSHLQWGVLQGRLIAYNSEGTLDRSVYLRTRGVKERSWAPHVYQGLKRSITITAATRDGTAVMLRASSYKGVLTEVISGCVRFPDYSTKSIDSTDLVMSDFCEIGNEIPKVYTIHVGTDRRDLKVILRINSDGGKLYSGHPQKLETVYRTVFADINGATGSGVLELTYESTVTLSQTLPLSKSPLLKWLSEKQAGDVGYCVSFESRSAACPDYVGGKGASLALLASVQTDEGYRVPPGFCLTTKALEKHLHQNPALLSAIREIEAANDEYEEGNFKAKCNKALELFINTELTGEVKTEILSNLEELRKKALEQKLGPQLRFAVRSSAVGEDSEALSAAGQNETILGCLSDEDVLSGVRKCWGSFFAFTSAYYRRQNGQPCLCGGGVVVQALVSPHVAGVMFTRHPDAGDPSRLLITANYGLGESVVSGSVEPDSIIIKRENGKLSIQKSDLGSKTQRVIALGEGVSVEDVPESDRFVSCLSEEEILKLAQLGVAQEELWGAGRDIEWAISGNEIFLLQARPITSLERWTEEELLHELDYPIMADDELTTFANTGEVMPRPITPITHDLVIRPLSSGMDETIGPNGCGYDRSVGLFNNRCSIILYNSVYKRPPAQLDVGVRMIEMAVHGHPVADAAVLATAQRRRPPARTDALPLAKQLFLSLTTSGWKVASSKNLGTKMTIGDGVEDHVDLLEEIGKTEEKLTQLMYNHSVTTTGSTTSQLIAMSVLMEGKSDFTPELCNEISALLSSGDVLSAEVPLGLAKLAKLLDESGRSAEFKKQDPKEAMQWLQNNLPHVYKEVSVFLEDHGHRAIMEFDLATKPWALAPEEMMKVLQTLRPSDAVAQKSKSDAEIVAALKSPQKNSTRKVLTWVMPLCRRAVRQREWTKAYLILAIHKIRLALLKLGKLLVKQWYIPNPDLVFFFRIIELREYIQTRDPALLKKAIQRQKYYSGWCKLRYAEINTGWVEPLETKGPQVIAGNLRVKATSVCGGEAIARACVIKDLSEIDQLQQGDILITHSTDIGWSPYFPLLTGIVTELGGLISHGAVIAREYGLPCIVGATNVTDIFHTGDLVRLSGTEGVLEKVEVDENQAS